ncbi:hypothetical protein SDRG_16717 [Saprolegnia diclina VS20]|uniref:Uncharacterized protein n=1 Tax=Saprolegnia diclina (strain VS20) TaxID=1156394 RepID=T0R7E9_SAPDV|nr:hypothetical protein SDRG_16717 [Saprolegnia diclina VS20]EQC25417.1 hypothetical protein SDRG_16717 [Saprolegnia diclina VS20]|eukprot:XP_008621157.1 hypothetical protein SDRG_16717 [Saprolegnia diclina VS20]
MNGHEIAVKWLIEADAQVNRSDRNDKTALMLASANGHDRVVKRLLVAGVNVHLCDNVQVVCASQQILTN